MVTNDNLSQRRDDKEYDNSSHGARDVTVNMTGMLTLVTLLLADYSDNSITKPGYNDFNHRLKTEKQLVTM